MRAVWIDNGQDVNAAKLRAHGIDAPYFDPRDGRVTSAYLDGVHEQGFNPGLYFAWNWYNLDGSGFAGKIHSELLRIGWRGNAPVCADIEVHDPAYITAFVTRWRQLRPSRQTDLTIEGMQGGWFAQCAAAVAHADIRVAPQFYDGSMNALSHSPVLDLLIAGVPGDMMLGMYDASRLPYQWRGYAFTQGRLT